jgi:hypothetical protein
VIDLSGVVKIGQSQVEVNRSEAKRAGEVPQAAMFGGQEVERDIMLKSGSLRRIAELYAFSFVSWIMDKKPGGMLAKTG